MSHQFKPGDLAITLMPCAHLEAGSVVELITSAREDTVFEKGSFIAGGDGWVVEFRCGAKAFFVSEYLMPLRGDSAPASHRAQAVSA